MNQEVRHEWAAALRSGEYKQGRMALTREAIPGTPKTYCCLGVLCDVMVKRGFLETAADVFGGLIGYRPAGLSEGERRAYTEFSFLPNEVVKELDFEGLASGQLPFENDDSGSASLAYLNDGGEHPLTLPQIADVIDYFYGDGA